jgi:Cu-Zn family superoxide dismutase
MSERTRGLSVAVIVVFGVAAVAFFVMFGAIAFAADPVYDGTAVKTVTATLQDGNGVPMGSVQLSQDAKGVVQVTVSGSGLSAGEHGIHVHATGKCDGPAFASANAHFNVTNHQHGLLSLAGPHEGDLPGLTAVANGTYTYTATTDRISLTGGPANVFDADGSALIIHAAKDDQLTDPTGNSGGRVACAVIAAATPAAPLPPATGTGSAPASSEWSLGFSIAAIGGALALAALRFSRLRQRAS